MAKYAVIYDACVLYPAPLRDFLIQLATANLFRAQWSEAIHDEWSRNVLKNRADLKPEAIKRTRDLMNAAVPDSCVHGFEHLIDLITLPDANDRHVVAAAIHAKADAIVTFNLKDFPDHQLQPRNLEAIHPDDFITYQIDLNDAAVLQSATACCRRLKSPPKSGAEYLDTLLVQKLPKTVAALRPFEKLISADC